MLDPASGAGAHTHCSADGSNAFELIAGPLALAAWSKQVLMGFDFGTRRIGIAIGNGVTGAARPLTQIAAREAERWPALTDLIATWQPAALIVGVPRHPDGVPHAMTTAAMKFARQLAGRYRLPVCGVDERYSTAVLSVADQREHSDASAAAVILQQFLDVLSESQAP